MRVFRLISPAYLDKIQADFLSILPYSPREEIVKLMVLSPMLSIANLSRFPFIPQTEQSIAITLPQDDTEEDAEVIRGRIDVLL
jgi:hypothetical protein